KKDATHTRIEHNFIAVIALFRDLSGMVRVFW